MLLLGVTLRKRPVLETMTDMSSIGGEVIIAVKEWEQARLIVSQISL